jgi:hypothetical protein
VLHDKVFADARVLNGLDDVALATAVTEWVHQHTERERQLLGYVRDAAGSGVAAMGLSQVAAALNAGRVAHLVYDPNIRYTGTVGADGALYGGEEVSPDGHPGTPEPRLTERLVEPKPASLRPWCRAGGGRRRRKSLPRSPRSDKTWNIRSAQQATQPGDRDQSATSR